MAESIIIPESVMLAALKKAIEILIARYDQLDMRASGRWAEELEALVEGNVGIIRGEDYTEYLTKGRKPGGAPPVQVIYQWMLDKKTFRGEKSLGRAFAIAKTIGERGTSWYQIGGTDLLEILQDNEALQAYYNVLGDYLRVNISEQLIRGFKELQQ